MERTDTFPARRHQGPIGNPGLRLIFGIALAFTWLVVPVGSAFAKTATNQIAVGATAQPYAHLTATQPSQLIIASKDVNLGYVNVPSGSNPSGTRLTIKTNDRAGYTLVFQVAPTEQALFKSIQVFGLGTTVTLPATGGKVTMPFPGAAADVSLTYRFNLVNKLKDGTYAWPLTVTSQPN
ncbi:hypothetical protein ACQUJS_19595 [Ralstonia pseudosolanacearum]|uniref:Uncharacterized protein n=1 Tax=Ralstonia solanacearum TaxID=305 RepID=A0A0S4TRM5_RALSL|nr:hypothetical protein [Ralstonia pseudosolanacearum]QCX51374.1 hypothetical protein E7Z57_20060 [Ralstonia pseudosolanacearum]CUV12715.1 conserved exported protein of unknown function [Ralstonia solanacearum]